MENILNKLVVIIGQILVYSKKVTSINKPIFMDDRLLLTIHCNDVPKELQFSYSNLVKVYDHSLEDYILSIFIQENLL